MALVLVLFVVWGVPLYTEYLIHGPVLPAAAPDSLSR